MPASGSIGLPVLPGALLTLQHSVAGLEPGFYVLLSNPSAPMVRLCRANLDELGKPVVTPTQLHISREDLQCFSAVPNRALF